MTKKIQWLKWEDPFLPKKNQETSELQEQKDSFEDGDSLEDRHIRVIAGPYGLLPLNENSVTGKLYKLWVGHCNFDITESVKNKIEQVSGVEILRIWTRYRFWLGIGNLFDDFDVHKKIEKILTQSNFKKENAALTALIRVLKKKYEHWIIFKNENGDMKTVGGSDPHSLKKEVSNNENIEILACSWKND